MPDELLTDDLLYDDVPLVKRRRRGSVRIILGGLGAVVGVTGLLKMATIAVFVATVIAPLTAAPVSFGAASGTVVAAPTVTYYLYVPSTVAATATCTVEGSGGVSWSSQTVDFPAHIVDVEYTQIGALTVAEHQRVAVTCEGATDVAVTGLGMLGTTIAFGALLLCALALLVSGSRAWVRTRRPRGFTERL